MHWLYHKNHSYPSFIRVNHSFQCINQDVHLDVDNIEDGSSPQTPVDGDDILEIAVLYWSIIVSITCFTIILLRYKFQWPWLTERFDGSNESRPKRTSSWFIDEDMVGKDGVTYLWFHWHLFIVLAWIMGFSLVEIVFHKLYDKKDHENYSYSATSYSIGLPVHWMVCIFILLITGLAMYKHGQKCCIKSVASPMIPDKSCNRRWLMISRIPNTITADSLFDYLKTRFNSKGLRRNKIHIAYDLRELWPVIKQLQWLREIKRTLQTTGPQTIQNRVWEFTEAYIPYPDRTGCPSSSDRKNNAIYNDALTYYCDKEEILLTEKDVILKNLKSSGIVFVGFYHSSEAKATKKALEQLQKSRWLLSRWFQKDAEEDEEFRPSQWTVRYAAPDSQINWKNLEQRRPIWKKAAFRLGIIVLDILYLIAMSSPGYIIEQLVVEGSDDLKLIFNLFVLPHVVYPMTSSLLTRFVTTLNRHRQHTCRISLDLARMRTICYLSILLNLIRMVAIIPLPLMFEKSQMSYFRWECLLYPEHGKYLACALIADASMGVVMDHTRSTFLLCWLWNCVTSRSKAERTVWRQNYRLDFDFASSYAEITFRFGLTILIVILFPVLGVFAWVWSLVHFISDRKALMEIYAISEAGYKLHREAVNMIMNLAVGSPLVLLSFDIILLKTYTMDSIDDISFIALLCTVILCILYLIYGYLRLYWPLPGWNDDVDSEEEEEDLVDSIDKIHHDYDILAKIREERLSDCNV